MQEASVHPLLTFLLLSSLVASAFVWTRVVSRVSQGQPLFPTSPRRDVPWRGIHVGLAFLVYLILPQLAFLFARWKFNITDFEQSLSRPEVFVFLMAAQTILFLVAVALIVTYLRIDLDARLADLGWSARDIGKDIVLGICAFVAIAPPVFVLQYLLLLVYRQLYDDSGLHPIIENILEQPTTSMLVWSTISAVFVAPLVEEFLFRVVLQGWLEKVIRGAQLAILMMQDNKGGSGTPDEDGSRNNPYAAPAVGTGQVVETVDSTPDQLMPAPILISAMVFAMFHVGHGPAPIPLFLLALVLGYVYQKTHRILPSLVVHFLLNGTTVINLWIGSG